MECPKCKTSLGLLESGNTVVARCMTCGFQRVPGGVPLPASEVFSFREKVWQKLNNVDRVIL